MFETYKAFRKVVKIQQKQTELIKTVNALNKLEKINRKNEGKIQEQIVSLEKEIEKLTGINRPIRKDGKIDEVKKEIYSVDESTTKKTDSKVLDNGTYFVEKPKTKDMKKALENNGLEKVSTVKACAGKDNVLIPKQKNGKTVIPTDEWNEKIQACKEVMQYVKNGKPTPFIRGVRKNV